MAITSTTGTVNGTEVEHKIHGKGDSRGHGVIAYIDYTKAGADDVNIGISYREKAIDGFYDYSLSINDVLTVITINISATGKYRLPIPVAQNEDYLKITVNGLDTGTFNIEFRADQGHR